MNNVIDFTAIRNRKIAQKEKSYKELTHMEKVLIRAYELAKKDNSMAVPTKKQI